MTYKQLVSKRKSYILFLPFNFRMFTILEVALSAYFYGKDMSKKFGIKDTLTTRTELVFNNEIYNIFSLEKASAQLGLQLDKMPYSIRVLLENLLRFEDNITTKLQDIKELFNVHREQEYEISFRPARVLMQDFTGVPAIVDLAAMRDAMVAIGGNPQNINPLIAVDLVIDHSVQVDYYNASDAFKKNTDVEMQRNQERYKFLRWGQQSFNNFRVVPPQTGICHQVNIEHLAKVVCTEIVDGKKYLYPDTVVGTDSHTTMVNALGVLGWGVGGIEAEAAMLGQPVSMLIPKVVGVKLKGTLNAGINATDLVLHITHILRKHNVVGKFVEFFGDGLSSLSLANRATISNMAPEYGATCGFFPIDEETIKYLVLTGRDLTHCQLVKAYAQKQKLWYNIEDPVYFHELVEIDLATIGTVLAGPKRPQDKVALADMSTNFTALLPEMNQEADNVGQRFIVEGQSYDIGNGDVVISAITSCTNTSNPYAMIGAGLMAKKAVNLGLKSKPYVKTSIAPGSQAVTEYLKVGGLDVFLDKLGFFLVGYGCTTCIGNSGSLSKEIEDVIMREKLVVCSVLSGNRNFEGRVHPLVRANYLASPLLCIAYAIAGSVQLNLQTDPIAKDKHGRDVYLSQIWPTDEEIEEYIMQHLSRELFVNKYKDVFAGSIEWQAIPVSADIIYPWDDNSSYIKRPPYFANIHSNQSVLQDIENANILAVFGDSITTDHISPAGNIAKNSPAAEYLLKHNVSNAEFNSYGARRGNHEVMARGTFANPRIKNQMLDGIEGGYTRHNSSPNILPIYAAAELYAQDQVPLVIFAGKEYGTGSSRDWAAKGTKLLGVKVVIAESFERIHRSNLVGMGVLPFVLKDATVASCNLKGDELIHIRHLTDLAPRKEMQMIIERTDGTKTAVHLISRIDTEIEMLYIKAGGILNYMIDQLKDL